MKIQNIKNISYQGIKVLKTQDDKKSLSTTQAEIERLYENMSDEFERKNSQADSLHIKTKDEQEKEIKERYEKTLQEGRETIQAKYSSFIKKPLKVLKLNIFESSLAAAEKHELSKTRSSIELDKQEALICDMQKLFDETMKKIEEIEIRELNNPPNNKVWQDFNSDIVKKIKGHKGFDSVAGYEYEKQVLYKEFISKVQMEKEGYDINVPGSVLFFGPWNNGKTYITSNIAAECDCRNVQIAMLRRQNIMEKLLEEAKKAQTHFEQTNQRTIIFIDELDGKTSAASFNKEEFEEFLSTCSKKYHCSVFAATNHPSRLGLNLDNSDIFPIRMSIDIPDDKNLKAVLKFYLDGLVQEDTDYDKLVKEFRKQEQIQGGKYNIAQIALLADNLATENKNNLTQNDVVTYIKQSEWGKPRLEDEEIATFEEEYKKIIGE